MVDKIKVAWFSKGTDKDTVLGKNGTSLDNYCTSCKTEENLEDGNFIADLTFVRDNYILGCLEEEHILKIKMDYGYEIFRISKVQQELKYIYITARQITIVEELGLWLNDVRIEGKNGQGALTYLLTNATGVKEIELKSNITDIANAYYVRKNLYEALHNSDNSFIKMYNAEVQRRGYTVTLNSTIGQNKGFTIEEGKNLTGFICTSNADSVVTRAAGQGLNTSNNREIISDYVDSPIKDSYSRTYTKIIKYDDVKTSSDNEETAWKTEEDVKAELKSRIEKEFSINNIDKIQASYTINFIDLSKTEEYKNYQAIETVQIGDKIKVKVQSLGIELIVRVVKKKYNVLLEQTIEVELSNAITVKPLTIQQIADKIEELKDLDGTSILAQAQENATELMKAGLKDSYVVVKNNEILIMDTQDINTANKVWRWNNNGLSYSGTGYYGTYNTAITSDGKIVADFITTGVLNANLIKAGTITSINGFTSIDLESGIIKYLNNTGNGVKLDKGGLIFYNNNIQVGGLMSSTGIGDTSVTGTSIVIPNSGVGKNYFSVGVMKDNIKNFDGHWENDIYLVFSNSKNTYYDFMGLQVQKDLTLTSNCALYFRSDSKGYNKAARIYNSDINRLEIYGDSGIRLGFVGNDGDTCYYRAEIKKEADENGNVITLDGNVGDSNGNRFYKQNYCPSQKIDNLNSCSMGGFYYFEGAEGAPCYKGTLLVLEAGKNEKNPNYNDFTQLVLELQANSRPDIYYRTVLQSGSKFSAWQKVTTEWWNG